jgi:hypothetical protein
MPAVITNYVANSTELSCTGEAASRLVTQEFYGPYSEPDHSNPYHCSKPQ